MVHRNLHSCILKLNFFFKNFKPSVMDTQCYISFNSVYSSALTMISVLFNPHLISPPPPNLPSGNPQLVL